MQTYSEGKTQKFLNGTVYVMHIVTNELQTVNEAVRTGYATYIVEQRRVYSTQRGGWLTMYKEWEGRG